MDTPTSQEIFKDDQNFEVDINKVYDYYIKAIDNARSVVNITNPNNQKLLSKFTRNSFTGSGVTSHLKCETTPQESRCHAFYRLIGFPVVSSDMLFYNPGFDMLFYSGRTITINSKVEIANKPLPGFSALSIFREMNIENNLKIFSNNNSIDANVLAISYSNIREFAAPLKNEFGIEEKFDSENQSYNISSVGHIGNGNTVDLYNFLDSSGNLPTKFNTKRYHIIAPFIVDARIDLSTPALQKVGIPFVLNSSNLKISETDSVMRPLIERIIIDRFSTDNNLNAGETADATIANIKSINAIKDLDIINKISSGDIFGFSEQSQFIKHLNIIRAMMSALHKAKDKILSMQDKYYWLPVPNVNGPEFGSSVQPPFINLPEYLQTDNDRAIIIGQQRSIIREIDNKAAGLSGTPDRGYALSEASNPLTPVINDSMGDVNAAELKKLVSARNHDLAEANDALKTVEIIMGEFSGLGLCDIIAIIGALYIVPKENLLGLLDDDAFQRAKSSNLLNGVDIERPSIQVAQENIISTVKDFYNLMDKIYKDVSKDNN